MSEKVFQIDCWFEGRVQGVGFRFQTVQVAKGFEVGGTVRNLSDGRVHLYAEGEEAEVEAFVEAVGRELESYIRKTERRAGSGARRCEGFRLIH